MNEIMKVIHVKKERQDVRHFRKVLYIQGNKTRQSD